MWVSFTSEVAGLETILFSFVRQVEERYRVEQPEREQSAALGLKGSRSLDLEVMSRERTGSQVFVTDAPVHPKQKFIPDNYQLHPAPLPHSTSEGGARLTSPPSSAGYAEPGGDKAMQCYQVGPLYQTLV